LRRGSPEKRASESLLRKIPLRGDGGKSLPQAGRAKGQMEKQETAQRPVGIVVYDRQPLPYPRSGGAKKDGLKRFS
jgi:hypothetical protein